MYRDKEVGTFAVGKLGAVAVVRSLIVVQLRIALAREVDLQFGHLLGKLTFGLLGHSEVYILLANLVVVRTRANTAMTGIKNNNSLLGRHNILRRLCVMTKQECQSHEKQEYEFSHI